MEGRNQKRVQRAAYIRPITPMQAAKRREERESRRQEYRLTCKRLCTQCYQTYQKLMEQKQRKERYRRGFLEVPGILHFAQRILGFEQYERDRLEPAGTFTQKKYLDMLLTKLFEQLEQLESGNASAVMSEIQYAHNLNLDWERLQGPERKKLGKRLQELLHQEERQLEIETGAQDAVLFLRLKEELILHKMEIERPCKMAGETKGYDQAFRGSCENLRSLFLKEKVKFVCYEEADGGGREQWFLNSDGENYPCVIWEDMQGNRKLLLYGRWTAE